MSEKFTGRCECGALTYEFSNTPDVIANCYCKDCQRSSGGVMATYFSVAQDDFKLLVAARVPIPMWSTAETRWSAASVLIAVPGSIPTSSQDSRAKYS
ncbi:hypothetical protein QFZ23_002238 [Arthrobacter globiformis]|nr:hypothetical protein [Arthrobacter globiformis]